MTLRPIHIWIKAALKGCGASELAVLPPQQLLDCIDAEVSVAETVHGWGDLGYQNELGKDSDFLYNLWQVPLLAPAAGALTMHDNEGHDCYSLTDILRVNASICTQYGWEMSKAGTFPQIPVCKWQSASSMCVNTVPAGLEAVETGLYGFPKFKVRGAPSNFEEASGRFIYAGYERAVRVFDVTRPGRAIETRPTAATRKSRDGQRGLLSCLAFSPDGSGLYAAGSFAG